MTDGWDALASTGFEVTSISLYDSTRAPLTALNALLLLDCSIFGREALLLVLDLDGHSLAVG